MKQFLITVAGVLVGLIVFLVIAPIVLISMISASVSQAPKQPSAMVLSLDLREPMTDQRPQSPFAALSAQPALLDVLSRLEAARTDNAVKGLYIRANSDGMSAAHAEEIRTAIAAFRASGKFVIAHLQSEGIRTSLSGYSAVAGADELWLQETSNLPAMGLSAEVTFLANTLRRYHMQAQFVTREEYKTAAHTLTQSGFTAAHREEMMGLMNGIYDVMLANIAADREITPEQARAAVEATPITSARALELKLVDQLGRPEDAERAALARAGDKNVGLVELREYRPSPRRSGPVIAVVQGEGPIVTGPDETNLFGDEAIMRSDAVSQALLDAADDEDVRAIVFRVSSPGGSAVASDQILNALRLAKQAGKKVVVSMGEVAASGGYYVSADADEIVAEPSTITGSIGVLAGKLVLGDAMEHYLSSNTETLTVGSPYVTMFSAESGFSPAERAQVETFIDRIYSEFLTVVSQGRGMSMDDTHAVAHGRVWTGSQALERKLVDHLGGFSVAVERAKALAGIDADEAVQLRLYPQEKSPFEELSRIFGVSSEAAESMARLSAVLSDPRVAAALRAANDNEPAVRTEAEPIRIR